MTNRTDDKGAVISAVGTEVEYLQSLGATSDNVMSAWMELFILGGATSSNFNNAASEFLSGLGYTGALPDMWAAYWAAGGGGGVPAYDPAMMTFDGSTGYYTTTWTSSGNKMFATVRFNRTAFTGGGSEVLVRHLKTTSPNYIRLQIAVQSSDHATVETRNRVNIYVSSSAGVALCVRYSTTEVCDGTDHVLVFGFDGDTGASLFYIDGAEDANASHPNNVSPTIGTVMSGGMTAYVGRSSTAVNYYGGQLGYFGISDTYLTNPTDFYHPTNGLQELDVVTWTEWGAQPPIFSPDGDLLNNQLGSAGAFTKNGTITGPA